MRPSRTALAMEKHRLAFVSATRARDRDPDLTYSEEVIIKLAFDLVIAIKISQNFDVHLELIW